MLIWTKPHRPFDRRNKCDGGVVARGRDGRFAVLRFVRSFAINSIGKEGDLGRLQNGFAEFKSRSQPMLLSPLSGLVDLVSPR